MYNFSWKRRLHTSQAIDRRLRMPRTQQHLQLHCNFLFSEQYGYSKGERHISYSASILEINDMQYLSKDKGWLNKVVIILNSS